MESPSTRRRRFSHWMLRWMYPILIVVWLAQFVLALISVSTGNPGPNGANYALLVASAFLIVLFTVGWIISLRLRRRSIRESGRDFVK